MQAPVRAPKQERSRRRFDAILDAAGEEFADHGFAGTTTTAVAGRAGVPVGSLYQWFDDKEALLFGLAERHIAEAASVMLGALDRAASAADIETVVCVLVAAAIEANAGDPRVHRVLYREAPRPPELQVRLSELRDGIIDWVAGELHRREVVDGRNAVLRSRTLVLAVEALVHELVLDPPDGVDRTTTEAEVVRAALAIVGS